MSSGGGTPKSTSQTVTQSNVSPELMPYALQTVGRAQSLTDINSNPFQAYQGQRTAGFSPMQEQAYGSIAGMQPSAQLGQATGMAGLAGLGGLTSQRFGQGAADYYMSPYMQNVVNVQQQEAQRQADIAGTSRGARAATSGAFGGTRHALENAEAGRNLGFQMGDIQARGLQGAFDQAQQQFNTDEARRLQGYGVAIQGAGALGQLGQEAYGQRMGIAEAQQQAGAQQQALEQQALTTSYQDWLDQQNYPYKQLGFMSDIVRGTPMSGENRTVYGSPGSTMGQAAGLLGGLGSLYMGTKTTTNT